LLLALAELCLAEEQPKVVLDTSETLFTVLTAINACGYDQELSISDPLRAKIRSEVAKTVQQSEDTQEAAKAVCQFYNDHQQEDASRLLAQYESLALYLNPPPALAPKVKEADLPPDANYLLGFVPLLQKLYEKAGLHSTWQRNHEAYSALTDRYHEPLAYVVRHRGLS